MRRKLLAMVLLVLLSWPSVAQFDVGFNFGVAFPTASQSGLQIPPLMRPSGDRCYVGMGIDAGLDLSMDLLYRVWPNDNLFVGLTGGLIWMNQKYDVDSFSMTESFVPPSLNVMSYAFFPVTLGFKYQRFTRDEFFGWGVSFGVGTAYRTIRYSIMEMEPEDDLTFHDRGFLPCFQVGVECVLAKFMTTGLYLRKIGNGVKGGEYVEAVDEGCRMVDPSLFRQTFLTWQFGFLF